MPVRSRLTVKPAGNAPLVRRERLAESLRQSREAMSDIERQLGSLLAKLQAAETPGTEDLDLLRRAAGRAGAAVGRLR